MAIAYKPVDTRHYARKMENDMSDERTLLSRQVAAALGKKRDYIDRMAAAGEIPFATDTRRARRYNLAEVRRAIASRSGRVISSSNWMKDLDEATIGRIEATQQELREARETAIVKRRVLHPIQGQSFMSQLHGR